MTNGSAQLLGGKQLEKTFRTLGERVQRKVLRQAINAGSTVMMKAMRAKAPRESGLLAKSIGKKIRTYKKSGTILGVVGPRSDVVGTYQGKKRRPVKYAHLVEKGHITKSGQFVPAHPFMRPAFDETQRQVQDSIKSKLAVGVVREASK